MLRWPLETSSDSLAAALHLTVPDLKPSQELHHRGRSYLTSSSTTTATSSLFSSLTISSPSHSSVELSPALANAGAISAMWLRGGMTDDDEDEVIVDEEQASNAGCACVSARGENDIDDETMTGLFSLAFIGIHSFFAQCLPCFFSGLSRSYSMYSAQSVELHAPCDMDCSVQLST